MSLLWLIICLIPYTVYYRYNIYIYTHIYTHVYIYSIYIIYPKMIDQGVYLFLSSRYFLHVCLQNARVQERQRPTLEGDKEPNESERPVSGPHDVRVHQCTPSTIEKSCQHQELITIIIPWIYITDCQPWSFWSNWWDGDIFIVVIQYLASFRKCVKRKYTNIFSWYKQI